MTKKHFKTKEDLQNFAVEFASHITPPFKLYLSGEMGAGKTTFTQGLLRGLGYKGPVKSPTFSYLEMYEVAVGNVYHFDLYRAEKAALETLGFDEIFSDSSGIVIIEWPEKGHGYLEEPDVWVQCEYDATNEGRIFTLKSR